MAISGTRRRRHPSAPARSHQTSLLAPLPTALQLRHGSATPPACARPPLPDRTEHVLLINVRTLAIRFTIFAFTLAVSLLAPNPGSDCCVLPHPTARPRPVRISNLVRGRVEGLEWPRCGFGAEGDLLRARKRSSERMAMALTSRMETGERRRLSIETGELDVGMALYRRRGSRGRRASSCPRSAVLLARVSWRCG